MDKLHIIRWALLWINAVFIAYHVVILLSQYVFDNIIEKVKECVEITEHFKKTGKPLHDTKTDMKKLKHASRIILIITRGFIIELIVLSLAISIAGIAEFYTQAIGLSIVLIIDLWQGASNIYHIGMSRKQMKELRSQVIIRHTTFITIFTANLLSL